MPCISSNDPCHEASNSLLIYSIYFCFSIFLYSYSFCISFALHMICLCPSLLIYIICSSLIFDLSFALNSLFIQFIFVIIISLLFFSDIDVIPIWPGSIFHYSNLLNIWILRCSSFSKSFINSTLFNSL